MFIIAALSRAAMMKKREQIYYFDLTRTVPLRALKNVQGSQVIKG